MEENKLTSGQIFLRISVVFFITLWSIIFISSCDKSKPGKTGDWAVKIDDEIITVDEFNKYYYTQNKLALNLRSNEKVDELASDPSTLRPERSLPKSFCIATSTSLTWKAILSRAALQI